MNFKLIVKNSGISFISQILTLIIQFITRSVFIHYLGVDLLGLSSTFTSLLSTLSLAELGFQSAIVFSLYRPLNENDTERIIKIINVFRIVYKVVGLFLLVMSLILLPLLKIFISDIEVTGTVCVYFLLQAASSACTYFLAYKRTLLYADKKEYIYRIIDTIINTIFDTIRIISIVVLQNYIIFLAIGLVKVYFSNIIVHVKCKTLYPYLRKERLDTKVLKEVFQDVKQVFVGRLAGYVYNSTDSLVISAVVSTIQVGFYANYTIITSNLKILIRSILSPIAPIIGNILIKEQGAEGRKKVLYLYSHSRYTICLLVVVPFIVLIQDFITMWVGEKYQLSLIIVILLAIDMYIDIVHSALYDYIIGAGLFKEEKIVEIIGALTNIIISILGAYLVGIAGVLIGRVLSQIWFWFGRAYITFKYCLDNDKKGMVQYLIKVLLDAIGFTVVVIICMIGNVVLPISISVTKFIISGLCCEVFIAVFYVIFYSRSVEGKMFKDVILRKILKKEKH